MGHILMVPWATGARWNNTSSRCLGCRVWSHFCHWFVLVIIIVCSGLVQPLKDEESDPAAETHHVSGCCAGLAALAVMGSLQSVNWLRRIQISLAPQGLWDLESCRPGKATMCQMSINGHKWAPYLISHVSNDPFFSALSGRRSNHTGHLSS